MDQEVDDIDMNVDSDEVMELQNLLISMGKQMGIDERKFWVILSMITHVQMEKHGMELHAVHKADA